MQSSILRNAYFLRGYLSIEEILNLSPKTLERVNKVVDDLENEYHKLNYDTLVSAFILALSGETNTKRLEVSPEKVEALKKQGLDVKDIFNLFPDKEQVEKAVKFNKIKFNK